jgi:hypothetical protein
VLHRADADLPAQLVGISIQQRSQDVGEDSIALGSIVRDRGPHRRERVGKAVPRPCPAHRARAPIRRERPRTAPASCYRPKQASRRPPSPPERALPSSPSFQPTAEPHLAGHLAGGEPARARYRRHAVVARILRKRFSPSAAPAASRAPRRTASNAPRSRGRERRSRAWTSQAPRLRRVDPRRGCRSRRAPSPAARDLAEPQATPSWQAPAGRSARSRWRAPSDRQAKLSGR